MKKTKKTDEILERMFAVQVENAYKTRALAGKRAPGGTRREWDSVTAVAAPVFSNITSEGEEK